MKTLTLVAAIAAITISTSANAWFGNNGSNNMGNMNNTGMSNGATDGNFNSGFSFGMNGSANGRGNGNSYNAYNGKNAFNGNNGYAQQPYGYAPSPVMTKEQMDEQRAIAEKQQKEAAAHYQEMVKNAAQAPAQPAFAQPQPFQPAAFDQAAMMKMMQQQRADMMKIMEQNRKESEARHQNFLQKVKDARATTKVETQKS